MRIAGGGGGPGLVPAHGRGSCRRPEALRALEPTCRQVIEIDDPLRRQALAGLIGELEDTRCAEPAEDRRDRARRGVRAAITAANRVATGDQLSDRELAEVGHALTDLTVRDTLYALAVGRDADEAESLWTVLARRLPPPWRVEALVLVAFCAYARGDGPLAGISLEEAMRCDPNRL